MGGFESILKYLPGMSGLKEKVEKSLQNEDIQEAEGYYYFNDKKEKVFPDIIKASRKNRISKGSGSTVQDINKLLKQFKKIAK